MKVLITWIDVPEEEKDENLVVEKIGDLDKYLSDFREDLKEAHVMVRKRTRWGYRVKLDLRLPGRHIFAQEKGGELMGVLVKVREQAERQIKEYVERLREE